MSHVIGVEMKRLGFYREKPRLSLMLKNTWENME